MFMPDYKVMCFLLCWRYKGLMNKVGLRCKNQSVLIRVLLNMTYTIIQIINILADVKKVTCKLWILQKKLCKP